MIQTQFQPGRCIHACTNETHSLANLVDLLESVFYLCMHRCTCLLELCLYLQLDIASLLFVSLLFIEIPTPFLIFKFLFISSLFTFYCTIGPHLSALRFET